MINKWKEFLTITGISSALISGEIGWTGFLAWHSAKIPYIGIPIATVLSVTGIGCALFIGSSCYLVYKNWYEEYYS